MVAAATALIQVKIRDCISCIQYVRLLRKLQHACCSIHLVKSKVNVHLLAPDCIVIMLAA